MKEKFSIQKKNSKTSEILKCTIEQQKILMKILAKDLSILCIMTAPKKKQKKGKI